MQQVVWKKFIWSGKVSRNYEKLYRYYEFVFHEKRLANTCYYFRQCGKISFGPEKYPKNLEKFLENLENLSDNMNLLCHKKLFF